MNSSLPPKERSIQIILKRFHKLETIWDKPDHRKHELLKLKHFLQAKEKEPQNDLHFITSLHKHLTDDITLEQLWNLIVPIEREHSKLNITDEDFLITK